MKDEFKINKNRHTLNLSYNFLTDFPENLKILLDALVENSLKTHDLSDITIGHYKESISEFTNFLGKIKYSSIENIILSRNLIGRVKDDKILFNFFNNLKQSKPIKLFQLNNKNTSNNNLFVKNLNQFILGNELIEDLDISFNNIGADKDNIKSLFEILRNSKISKLNLFNNQLAYREEVLTYLSDFIRETEYIKVLDLGYNSLGEKINFRLI
jgi:hypothetical protein